MAIDPTAFCQKIWSLQAKAQGDGNATGFVAHKDWESGSWKDVPTNSVDDIPEMKLDWYFAPCLFTGTRRLREAARPSRVLYADLDEVEPDRIEDVPPTLAWETSPGRYQGLWVVDRPMKLEVFENVNRRLTYHVGADKGGWSSTKVLRVPGTISTKYGKSRKKRFTVRVCSHGSGYRLHDLQQLLAQLPESGLGGLGTWSDLPEVEDVLGKWRRKLPTRAKQLLRAETATRGDDRSARLYELEALLLSTGLSPEETLVLARGSAWNKYRGQRRELPQLKKEIRKLVEENKAKEVEHMTGRIRLSRKAKSNGHDAKLARVLAARRDRDGLPNLSYREFLDAHFPEPEWLVEGFWGLGAYGVWAGEYKSYKTLTLLDFALSVASGVPFLGQFKVHHTGAVLYAHDEGTPGFIQDRLRRIAWRKGLAGGVDPRGGKDAVIEFPKDLSLTVSTMPRLNLLQEESQHKLAMYCERRRPLVVILESFYLMAQEVNENVAFEVTPALAFLKDVAQQYGTSIILSHHYNKGSNDKTRAGSRMSGSNVFARWYESAVYLERKGKENESRALITAEHREKMGTGKQMLQISMDPDSDTDYDVTIEDKNTTADTVESGGETEIPLAQGGVNHILKKDKAKKLREAEFQRRKRKAQKTAE